MGGNKTLLMRTLITLPFCLLAIFGSLANATINNPPTAGIVTPGNDTVFQTGESVDIIATASDTDGIITLVEFYAGSDKIGESTTFPFQFSWAEPGLGGHTLTVVAYDDAEEMVISEPIYITVNEAPYLNLVSPSNGSVHMAGEAIVILADAVDNDDAVACVKFFSNGGEIGEVTQAPHEFVWYDAPAGVHQITARAYDERGGVTDWEGMEILVNMPPTVYIISPVQNAVLNYGETCLIEIAVEDSDGGIACVEFYDMGTQIGFCAAAPYCLEWNPGLGSHEIWIQVTDNMGAVTISDPVSLTVVSSNLPPEINMGNCFKATIGQAITIDAQVTDDGIPEGSTLCISWEKVSGPGEVNFSSPATAMTEVVFSEVGAYVLRLNANDSEHFVSEEMEVRVGTGANSGSKVIYQTDFNHLPVGMDTVSDQDEWMAFPQTGMHGTIEAFPGLGRALFVGNPAFTEPFGYLWRGVNYEPAQRCTPVIRFTSEIMINDSTNGFRDTFTLHIRNIEGELLAAVLFCNELQEVMIEDGTSEGAIAVGKTFPRNTVLHLDVRINFEQNTWDASLSGTQLFATRIFNASGASMTMGGLGVCWDIQNQSNPGDNTFIMDNLSIVADRGNSTTFANGNAIALPVSGVAGTYPSAIQVMGFEGSLNHLRVKLDGLTHAYPDLLLVAPDGQSVVLMSNLGEPVSMSGRSVVIDDLAPTFIPNSSLPIHTAHYRPSDFTPGQIFPAPAPSSAPLASLSGLYGICPNGEWKLFIMNDSATIGGSISGWSLEIGTTGDCTQDAALWDSNYFSPEEVSLELNALLADPDSDGICNLMEYAMGMNPRSSDAGSQNLPVLSNEVVDEIPCVVYHYQRDLSRTGITYSLEVSSDLVNWEPFTGADILISQTGTVETRQAYIPTTEVNCMIRLRVTAP